MRYAFFIFLFVCSKLGAQQLLQWQTTLGGSNYDQAIKAVELNDSTYSIIGNTLSDDGDVTFNHGGREFWLITLKKDGALMWQKTYGGSANEFPFDMVRTTDNGLIIVGYSLSDDGDVTENHGDKDAWVVKLNNSGTILWQKSLGGSNQDVAYSICETSDGYVFAGESYSSDGEFNVNHGVSDFWVTKLDKSGNFLWHKLLGGSGTEKANSILQTSDGGFILAGETKSNDGDVSGNHGSVDYWVVKLNSHGGIVWQKCFGGIGLDVAYSVTENNGYIICGISGSGNTGNITGHHGSFDQWILHLDYSGELIWQKPLGGSMQDYAYCGTVSDNQSYLAVGSTNSINGDVTSSFGADDLWITALDTSGNLLWEKSIGGSNSESGITICSASDSSLIIAGDSQSSDGGIPTNKGKTDFWILKLSPQSTKTHHPQPTQLTLYPNPTTQSITLQAPDNEPITSIQITDLSGKTLKYLLPSGDNTLPVAELPKGMYLLKAASGTVFCGKFIRE